MKNSVFPFKNYSELLTYCVKTRVLLGISQKDMANRLGIDVSNLCRIEKGRSVPSAKLFLNYYKILLS